MKKLLVLIALFTGCASIDPYPDGGIIFREVAVSSTPGVDILGLAGQDLKTVKQTLKPGIAIGALEGTFGDIKPPLMSLLETGKVSAWRVHLGDGTCIRNHTCASGSLPYSDYNGLQDRAKTAESIHEAFPTVPCYVSPFLEHDSKDINQVNRWFDILRSFNPSCTPVVSAFSGYRPPGILQEYHGNDAKGDIVSNDGESYFDSNVDRYKKGGKKISFAWWYRLNKRTSGEKGTPAPPKLRKPKATKDEFNQAIYTLINPLPSRPTFKSCPKAKEVSAPGTWKVRSEDYNGGDVRENKPVLIVNGGPYTKGFNILTSKGKLVGCLKYYGAYSGLKGYYRYYIGNCSGQNPWELFKEANEEWVCLKNGSTQFAVSSLRRSGSYR